MKRTIKHTGELHPSAWNDVDPGTVEPDRPGYFARFLRLKFALKNGWIG